MSEKLCLPGETPAADPAKLIRIAGLGDLDEATLLGALMTTASILKKDVATLHAAQDKGREALKILSHSHD